MEKGCAWGSFSRIFYAVDFYDIFLYLQHTDLEFSFAHNLESPKTIKSEVPDYCIQLVGKKQVYPFKWEPR